MKNVMENLREKGLNRTQLKYLAILAMVIDHTAWGFVEFMSPLGQAMHIFGRLTVPIMCYFIAEGYAHTSNLKKYVERMLTFALVTILPFYVFFHEEYEYRQNIIFDLMLALLALCAMEHKQWSKPVRIAVTAGIFGVSATIGGWVILPIIYVLVFYYSKDFKTKAKRFCLWTIIFETVLIILILLNQRYHFSQYEWTVQERLYLLGFMLALIPLYFYNGQKGESRFGRYFFYWFYPAHFCVLALIKFVCLDYSPERLYIMIHVAALLLCLAMLFFVATVRTSRAQMATTLFLCVSCMYIFGFLLEITNHEVAGVYTATKLQYFAECLVIIAFTFCLQELCKTRIPAFVYAGEVTLSLYVMYAMFTYEKNGMMYSAISINDHAGKFPRMEIEGYGIAFYIFLVYMAIVCIAGIIVGYQSTRIYGNVQKKRMKNLLYALICMWLPYVMKATNITNGYEIPATGVAFAAFFVGMALWKYDYLDSVTVSSENAVNFGKEGILVVDRLHRIVYHNEWIHSIFGELSNYDDAYSIAGVQAALEGKQRTMDKHGHIYELRVEPYMEAGEVTGQILWVFDLTEHYHYLSEVEEHAATDPLTGINNRGWFEPRVEELLMRQGSGAFIMLDLDNFKHVNDHYGHQVGDEVLRALAAVIKKNYRSGQVMAGRIGGDEFCLFYQNETDKAVLGAYAEGLIADFQTELSKTSCGAVTSITVGIALVDQTQELEKNIGYSKLYKRADRALYLAKEAGKHTYRIYHK